MDFRDGEYKSWDGNSGLEGGNHAFRDIFRNLLETQFRYIIIFYVLYIYIYIYIYIEFIKRSLKKLFIDREIPLGLELQSIEWHEDLHGPTGLDDVFDMICPGGSSGYIHASWYLNV